MSYVLWKKQKQKKKKQKNKKQQQEYRLVDVNLVL